MLLYRLRSLYRAKAELSKRIARIILRSERLGERVAALCSADGVNWLSIGAVEFPMASPLQPGLHAIGTLDRTVYHGSYPNGTAIRFESFEGWEM
jgi:hypothetical protein